MGIPCKTAAGHAELVARERRLSQRHRTLLLLIDGRRTLAEVRQMGRQVGVPPAYLDELLALGLIVMTDAVYAQPRPVEMATAQSPQPAAAQPVWLPPAQEGDWLPPAQGTAQEPAAADTTGLALSDTELHRLDSADADLAEARALLSQALRQVAPVSGLVCLLRLRRARDRHELLAVLPEVLERLARHSAPPSVETLRRKTQALLGI